MGTTIQYLAVIPHTTYTHSVKVWVNRTQCTDLVIVKPPLLQKDYTIFVTELIDIALTGFEAMAVESNSLNG